MAERAQDVVIRAAIAEEASVLASAERFHAQTPGMLVSAPDEFQDEAFADKIKDLSEATNGCYVVAVIEGSVVGHALLDPMPRRSTAHVVHLTIVVHPGFEGRGIGRSLMNYLIHWARAEPSVEKVELRVREGNARAIDLYRSLGFVEEGRFVRRIKNPDGEYLDDIGMGLWVGEPTAQPSC